MSTLGLAPNQYYWLRLELRTGTARDFADDSQDRNQYSRT